MKNWKGYDCTKGLKGITNKKPLFMSVFHMRFQRSQLIRATFSNQFHFVDIDSSYEKKIDTVYLFQSKKSAKRSLNRFEYIHIV